MRTSPPFPRAQISVRSAPRLAWPVCTAVAVIAALTIGWVGYSASDDAAYYLAAQHWLTAPPFAGHDHWATRFPLVLGLAASLRIVGDGAAALTVVAIGWYVAFLAAAHALVRRIGEHRAAWIAVILLATMPVVGANATTASCDLTEATFLMLGILWIGDVSVRPGDVRPAIAAGLAFGAAILCRETTALAFVGFVPLFLLGRPVSRRALIAMGIACAALLAGEALFQWLATGDPLNRWTLAFHHDSHIDRAANLEGNVLLHPAIDPLLVLLINDDFALIFWLAIAAVALRADRTMARPARKRMAILAMLALATFLLVSVLYTKLVLNPRYFMLPAIAATVVVAVWLDRSTVRLRLALLIPAVATNLLMLSVENAHPRWAAQALVIAGRDLPETTIVTDAETYHRALMPIRWAGLTHIEPGNPRPGALYLTAEGGVPATTTVMARYPSPRTSLGIVIDDLGLARFLPGSIRRRLLAPNPNVILVRFPGGPQAANAAALTASPSTPAPV